MKANNIVRVLAGLILLLLFCPFFEMCTFEKMAIAETDIVVTDSIAASTNAVDISEVITDDTETDDNSKSNSETISGWEFAVFPFKDFPDDFFNFFLFFTGCGLSSIAMMICSLFGKAKIVRTFAWLSTVLVILPLVIVLIDNGDPAFMSDIRFGYPLYIINSIAIIVLANKAIKQHAV